ncbi:MAG TPA: tetratricopeptide repeat protein [Stellaceae bacterium]|nr:tetratricopeptide repeat protein [Stellaceae bacterium]
MSDIFKEIDEELRRENFAKLWQRYGYYVIGFLVAVVMLTGVVMAWRGYQARLRAEEGERYQVAMALLHQGKIKEADAAFATMGQDSTRRAVLARFETAAILAQSGDKAGAVARYEAIAADAAVDPSFRDLATVLAVQNGLANGDPKRLIERLQPLVAGSGPWQPSALELTALAQLKAGDKKAAHATFQRLADDLTAPQGMRTRATEMVAALAP